MVVDSSTLVSLAWSGQLNLLTHAPLPLLIPEEVRTETVEEGEARGYPDAVAIRESIAHIPTETASSGESLPTVDEAVLTLARRHGGLFTNDLALGRRAQNFNIRWLRTADLVILCVRTEKITATHGVAALEALYGAGRITESLFNSYTKELS